MRIIAIERALPGATPDKFDAYARDEAKQVLEFYEAGIIREIYFTRNDQRAVLMLECPSEDDARVVLAALPFVKAGLISFDVMALQPYTGFSRLVGG